MLFYRELDLPLPEIAGLLEHPDRGDHHLRRQHALLHARLDRTRELLTAIEDELAAQHAGISLTPDQQLAIFGTNTFADHLAHASVPAPDGHGSVEPDDSVGEDERLARRTAAYTEDEWRQVRAEADATIEAFAAALAAGEPPDSPRARAAAEQHRRHLARWFFDCDLTRHVRVADGYLAAPTAAQQWDAVAPGFAQYVHATITANAHHPAR